MLTCWGCGAEATTLFNARVYEGYYQACAACTKAMGNAKAIAAVRAHARRIALGKVRQAAITALRAIGTPVKRLRAWLLGYGWKACMLCGVPFSSDKTTLVVHLRPGRGRLVCPRHEGEPGVFDNRHGVRRQRDPDGVVGWA